MKRLLILLALLVMVMPVAGLSLTFQDTSEFGAYVTCSGSGTHSCSYVHSKDGMNSYIKTSITGSGSKSFFMNIDPLQTTYAAATGTGPAARGYTYIVLLDSGGGVLYEYKPTTSVQGRYEVKMVSGKARIYVNNLLVAESGALAQNPSYVGFGNWITGFSGTFISYWDDFVYGTSENRYIFGSSEQGYFIKKDMLNPSSSGFCWANGTIISNYNMTTTWAIGEINTSQTVIFKEWSSGTNSWTKTTTAGEMNNSIAWPLQEALFNNPSSPYGYYITTISGSGQVSTVTPYWAYGASIAFDQDTYSQGDTATITWSVDAGGYWDPATYDYRIDVVEFLTGDVIDTYTVTGQTGGTSTTFTTSDDVGVYYAVIIATPKAGGSELQLNGDTCELTAYLVIHGYVNDAETTARIPVSKIKFYSNGVANYINTVDGNYTTTASFLSGSQMIINVTSTGYRPYAKNFTPLEAKTIGLNFTLIPSVPSINGISIGGVNRDSVYGRPIASVTDTITNTTFGESYAVTANSVGYYLADEDDGIFLTNGRLYCVSGSKTGYSTSGQYCLTVVAS